MRTKRKEFKASYLSGRKPTVLNANDNVRADLNDWDQKLKNIKYTGGQLIPTESELKKVLKRRKSRQSTDMPTQVDFEYVGNSSGALNTLVRSHNRD